MPCMNGDIRLIGGQNQGRVEVCYANQWGSVCADNWGVADARVACRQLGFPPLGLLCSIMRFCYVAIIIFYFGFIKQEVKFSEVTILLLLEPIFSMISTVWEMNLHC